MPTFIRLTLALSVASLAACVGAQSAKTFQPPDPLNIQAMTLYADAECDILLFTFDSHLAEFIEVNESLKGQALGSILGALSDRTVFDTMERNQREDDQTGEVRRSYRDGHLEHMQFILEEGNSREPSCEVPAITQRGNQIAFGDGQAIQLND